MIDSQVQIECGNSTQQENFAKWFSEVGFDLFTKSEYNTKEVVTCLATDEKMDWGHYFQIE